MKQLSSRSARTLPSFDQLAMFFRPSWLVFVTVSLLVLLLLSGCAGNPSRPQCQYPEPNPDLTREPPVEGYFRKHLDQILGRTSTGTPTLPTN